MRKRFACGLLAVLSASVGVGLAAGPASAAPTGSKNAFGGTADCGAAGTYTFVVNNANGQGKGTNNGIQAQWAPAHLNTGQVFHPTVFDLTFTFTPVDGPSQSFTDNAARTNQVGNTTCHLTGSQTNPFGTFSLEGSVVGTVTPS